MTNRIPRGILWKDKETLLQSPVFNALHEVFFTLEKAPMLFPMDEEIILNEVNFLVTWLCYESRFGMNPDMEQFTREVFARMGFEEHAMTVISLVYATVELVSFPPLEISKDAKRELKKIHKDSWCRRYADNFIKRLNKEGIFFEEHFLLNQEILKAFLKEFPVEENQKIPLCAEPLEEEQDDIRRFTLDDIVDYAKENLTIEIAYHIQLMLHTLMQNDSTKEEREKVSSIPAFIRNRNTGDQVQGNKTSFGNYSNMLNFNLPENADYEKFFAALPDDVKQMMIKKLISNDNG